MRTIEPGQTTITFAAERGGHERTFNVPSMVMNDTDQVGRYASLSYKTFCAIVGCAADKTVWDQPDVDSVYGAQMVWAKAHNQW